MEWAINFPRLFELWWIFKMTKEEDRWFPLLWRNRERYPQYSYGDSFYQFREIAKGVSRNLAPGVFRNVRACIFCESWTAWDERGEEGEKARVISQWLIPGPRGSLRKKVDEFVDSLRRRSLPRNTRSSLCFSILTQCLHFAGNYHGARTAVAVTDKTLPRRKVKRAEFTKIA